MVINIREVMDFSGTLFANLLTPLAKYFGKQAVSTGVRMGHDLLEGRKVWRYLS